MEQKHKRVNCKSITLARVQLPFNDVVIQLYTILSGRLYHAFITRHANELALQWSLWCLYYIHWVASARNRLILVSITWRETVRVSTSTNPCSVSQFRWLFRDSICFGDKRSSVGYKLFKSQCTSNNGSIFFAERVINIWNSLLYFSTLPSFRRTIQNVDFFNSDVFTYRTCCFCLFSFF